MSARVLTVVGTRPEAIKMAPVLKELAGAGFSSRLCLTGQHRELARDVLPLFGIEGDFDLDLLSRCSSLDELTAEAVRGLGGTLADERPDVVLVHGDTTSCFAAALAAFHADVPVAHVEAGLRTGRRRSPFPEEMNRRLVASLADLHFAPTEGARENLLAEGVSPHDVVVSGNTVVDALLHVRESVAALGARDWLGTFELDLTRWVERRDLRTILVTAHRRENHGERLVALCRAVRRAAEERGEWHFIFPVHPNPAVRETVEAELEGVPGVTLLPPVPYAPFVWLMDRVDLVLTDSGGIQEEAPTLGVPVLLARDVTERPEGLRAGTVRLVGASAERICAGLEEVLDDEVLYGEMARARNPYGDGHAAERIVRELTARFGAAEIREAA